MRKQGLLIGGFSLLAVIGVAGWLRKPAVPAPDYFAQSASFSKPATAHDLAPPTPEGAAPAVYGKPAPAATAQPEEQVRPAGRRHTRNAVTRRSHDRGQRSYVVQKRKFSHSAAIVGGSAAAGAAIGGLAGGGKGAAIGALSGGAAGLIYDRATHKKEVPVE